MVSFEISICLNAYFELTKDRVYYEGVPSPITFKQCVEFYDSNEIPVAFYLFKAIIGELDVYELNRSEEERKARMKRK